MQSSSGEAGVAFGATPPRRALSVKQAGMGDAMSADRVGFDSRNNELYTFASDDDSVADMIDRVCCYAERLRDAPASVRVSHPNAELKVAYRPGVGFDLALQYYELMAQPERLKRLTPRFINSPRMAIHVFQAAAPYQLDPRNVDATHGMLHDCDDAEGLRMLRTDLLQRMQPWRKLGYGHELTALGEGRPEHAPNIAARDPVNASLLTHTVARLNELGQAPANSVYFDANRRQLIKTLGGDNPAIGEAMADLASAAANPNGPLPATLVLQQAGRPSLRIDYDPVVPAARLFERLTAQQQQAEQGLLASIRYLRFDSGFTLFMEGSTLSRLERGNTQINALMADLLLVDDEASREPLREQIRSAWQDAATALQLDNTDTAARRAFALQQLPAYMGRPDPDLPALVQQAWRDAWRHIAPETAFVEPAPDPLTELENKLPPLSEVTTRQIDTTRHLFQLNLRAQVSPNTPPQVRSVLSRQLEDSYVQALNCYARDPIGSGQRERPAGLDQLVRFVEALPNPIADQPQINAASRQFSLTQPDSALSVARDRLLELQHLLLPPDYRFEPAVHLHATQHGMTLRAETFDGVNGHAEQLVGRLAANGDRCTGDFNIEDGRTWFTYVDRQGKPYAADDLPATPSGPDSANSTLDAAVQWLNHCEDFDPPAASPLVEQVIASGNLQEVQLLHTALQHKLDSRWPGEQWRGERLALGRPGTDATGENYLAQMDPLLAHWLAQSADRLLSAAPQPAPLPQAETSPTRYLQSRSPVNVTP